MKLLIITGQTSTGKTQLGIKLAQKYNGEIVSADSRHVFKGMDIGTGKDISNNSPAKRDRPLDEKFKKINKNFSAVYRFKNGIPIWLVDVVNPDYLFNLADYIRISQVVIKDIWQRNKLPIIVGGTGLYIKSAIMPLNLVNIPRNINLRLKLEKLELNELIKILKKTDQNKWESMNFSDKNNPRRLIRAIEIAKSGKNSLFTFVPSDWLLIYLYSDNKNLYKKIDKRVDFRIKQGIVKEIEGLLNLGFNFDLPSFSATPYKLFKSYFSGGKNPKDLKVITEKWKFKEHHLARTQSTWFKKMVSELPHKNVFQADINIKEFTKTLEERVGKWYTSTKDQRPMTKV